MERKELDQKFLNNLIQQSDRGELSWWVTENTDENSSYICAFPKRIQVNPLSFSPLDFKAVDLILHPDRLDVVDTTNPKYDPILQFKMENFPSHLPRLLELAETQRIAKDNEKYAKLMEGFLKD
jgi:hypothetical protein